MCSRCPGGLCGYVQVGSTRTLCRKFKPTKLCQDRFHCRPPCKFALPPGASRTCATPVGSCRVGGHGTYRKHYRPYLADTMIVCYSTSVLPPAVAGWLAGWLHGFNPLPPAALTPKWPFPLAVKCQPPVQPHSVPRATHVDVFLGGNPMSGRACIYSFFDCQSLSLSQSPPAGVLYLSLVPLRPFFVNGKSPDLVPLFVLVRAALVTPVRVRCPLSNPKSQPFVFVRATCRSRLLLAAAILSSLLPGDHKTARTATATATKIKTKTTPEDRLSWYFLACQLESTSTSTSSSRIHSLRSLS